MSIIITTRFKNKYLNKLIKNFSKSEFITMLQKKQHTFISLHEPYFKIKSNVRDVSIRWVLVIMEDSDLIPIMLFLKKDKKYWDNVNWKDYKDLILEEFKLNIQDIKNWDYEKF